jgi:isoamylase
VVLVAPPTHHNVAQNQVENPRIMIRHKSAVWHGDPYPLGAAWDGQGVNFALFSEGAEKVELCLFDERGESEVERIVMPEQTAQVWHCYLPEARSGLLYGYRVYGPYAPRKGLRFNANKLLLDPYAKCLAGALDWSDAHFGYKVESKQEDLSFDERDSAAYMPKCRVIETAFDWGDDRAPGVPWNEMVIYELHVKGMTFLHPQVPQDIKGTFNGLASEAAIEHFKRLGITTVELMPIHSFVHDRRLINKGLRNYWGYNTIGFFAAHTPYSNGNPVHEFKQMVKALHAANIEVILDVVYNHTAEGNELGPTLCFRGIDNQAYYRLNPDDPRYYVDYTGTGNTLNMVHPQILQLIMDSLRYWTLQMHVDGFRFDLASALARELHEVDRLGAFFDIIHQDPVLSQVKLIAEPWDLGEGGYQVGNFPLGWAEWNGKYRDAVRAYWRGEGGIVGELGFRLTGSSDLYEHGGRRPFASINFVTAHDGFTLQDLVSYNEKHNEANREDNHDGSDNNLSWNCGVEGPSEDSEINALRKKQKRNFLATLFLSQGVPMLLAGDEIGRTQGGNNNAYCQDNESSWLNWELGPENQQFLEFVSQLIHFRMNHAVFRRRHFFQGRPIKGESVKDIVWLTPEGKEMSDQEWHNNRAHCLGAFFFGEELEEYDTQGNQLLDSNFVLLLNAFDERIPFRLPQDPKDGDWEVVLDTDEGQFRDQPERYEPGDNYPLQGHSLVLLMQSHQQHVGD